MKGIRMEEEMQTKSKKVRGSIRSEIYQGRRKERGRIEE
jgi:hypothetical protein